MRFALSLVALALLASPAFANGRQPPRQASGGTANPGRSDISGRAPSPIESGVVAFKLPQDITDLITGEGVAPGLLYKGTEIGLTQATPDIDLTLCLADDHVPMGSTWGCKRRINIKLREVNRGNTPELLADMIQTGGTYRLYWDIPAAKAGVSRERRGAYTEWSKPFRVRGKK
jgi:hypothetical protein